MKIFGCSGPFRPQRLPLAVSLTALLILAGCGPEDGAESDEGALLVIEGARVFTSAMAEPLEDGVVVVLDGVVEAVGERGRVQVPPAARRVPASGLSLLAGFWNADVRLDDELLELARQGTDGELEEALRERFSRYGFTTIVETAGEPGELDRLLERVDAGVAGPRILPVVGALPAGLRRGSTAGDAGGFASPEELSRTAEADEALIPGLTRLAAPGGDERPEVGAARISEVLDRLGAFVVGGGALVFGTGAGYVPEWDPSLELLLLEEAGVPLWQILDALTFEAAVRFGHDYTGLVEPGMVADLVLVDGDPWADPGALERVLWVLRDGRTIYGGLE